MKEQRGKASLLPQVGKRTRPWLSYHTGQMKPGSGRETRRAYYAWTLTFNMVSLPTSKIQLLPQKRFWLMRWITPHPSGQCQPRGTQVFSQDSQSSHLNLEQNSIFPMFWGQNIRRGWMFAFCKMLFYLWIKLLLWLRVFGG